MVGGSLINLRVNLIVWVIIILWFGANYQYYKLNNVIIIYILILSLSLLSSLTAQYAEFNIVIKDYLAAINLLKSNSTFIRIFSYRQHTFPGGHESARWRVNYLYHADSYVAAEKNVVSFDNYEAKRGYFPVIYKNNFNKFIEREELNLSDLKLLSGSYDNIHDPDYIIIILGFNEEDLLNKKEYVRSELKKNNYHQISSADKYNIVLVYQKNSAAN